MTSATDGLAALPVAANATPTMSLLAYDSAQPEGARAQRLVAPAVTVLFSRAIPFFVAPTGTMANNGAITLGTALSTAYANSYIFLPAGAIAAGIPAAGTWYFCQMSSTTVGTVFNNTYVTGVPAIPASPLAFVTTGPGAYTGPSTSITAHQLTIPANTMGPNGRLRISILAGSNNSAGSKAFFTTFGGSQILNVALVGTAISGWFMKEVANRGVAGSQVFFGVGQFSLTTSTLAPATLAIDTTAAVALNLNINFNTATDWGCIESAFIELIPG